MTRQRLVGYVLAGMCIGSGCQQWYVNLLDHLPVWPYLVTPLLIPLCALSVILTLARKDRKRGGLQ